MIAQTFDEWWIPFTPAQQGHGYHEPSYRSIAQASWQARDAEVASIQAKLLKVKVSNDSFRAALNEKQAKLTEAERLNKVALEAMKEISDGPANLAAYHYGIRCGIEDRCLQQDPYSAGEYGYDEGLEYCAIIANNAIKEIEGSKP
jgi:hypothetical protein